MRRTILIGAVTGLVLTACAPGVTALGQGRYLTSVEGSGFESFDTLKSDATADAGKYCASQGKTAKIVDTKQAETVQRNVDVTFVCQ
jgi:hypothetical protein